MLVYKEVYNSLYDEIAEQLRQYIIDKINQHIDNGYAELEGNYRLVKDNKTIKRVVEIRVYHSIDNEIREFIFYADEIQIKHIDTFILKVYRLLNLTGVNTKEEYIRIFGYINSDINELKIELVDVIFN